MCVLCVMKPNFTPTREELKNAAIGNPHGYGYAFHCGDRIITGRGMDADEMIDRFLRIRSGMPNTWAMFHARYTTHGSTTKANCHPFRVGGDPSTVIAHNGIIPLELPKGEDRSDTRFFADEWMPELIEHLDDEEMFEEIEDIIGYSKIAVFTHDPRLKNQVYILGEDLGHWSADQGIWWSNDGYKPYISKYAGRKYDYTYGYKELESDTSRLEFPEDSTCIACGVFLVDKDYKEGMCSICWSCLDCGELYRECMCYTPASAKKLQYERDMSQEYPSLFPYDSRY